MAESKSEHRMAGKKGAKAEPKKAKAEGGRHAMEAAAEKKHGGAKAVHHHHHHHHK